MRAAGFSKYIKSDEAFLRQGPGRQDRVGFEIFKWPSAKVWNVTFRLKICFEGLERLLNELDPVGKGRHKPSCSVTRLIDNLYPKNIESFDWQVAALEDLAAAVPMMQQRLKTFGLPFFGALPNLRALREALEPDSGEWPVPTPESRAAVLLACLALGGEDTVFNGWVERLRAQVAKTRGGFFQGRFEHIVAALIVRFPRLAAADRR